MDLGYYYRGLFPPIRAIPHCAGSRHTTDGLPMQSIGIEQQKRRRERTKAVLPVRVRGTDGDGKSFEELAHTLDITPTGARLGGVRRALNALERITLTYRQRRIEFRVVWSKRIEGTAEYQVGLQALAA